MLEAMRIAKVNNGEICPYDSYDKFVDIVKKFDPQLSSYAENDRARFLRKTPSEFVSYRPY